MAIGLFACSGNAPPPPPPDPVDADLMSGWRLARGAFERGQYEQAMPLYERVLAEAYARDDLQAIADVGYELAVVRLRAGQHEDAAAEARRVREELARRGEEPLAELHLVEAVALYGAGDADGASTAASAAIDRANPDDALLIGRALYIRGAIAADRNDSTALEGALEQLGRPAEIEPRADRLELLGRLRLMNGRAADALDDFMQSAALRREVGDFVGMARSLGFAGEAAVAAGRAGDAADLYFRAGRSAAVEGRESDARRWLEEAVRLADLSDDEEIGRTAAEILEGL